MKKERIKEIRRIPARSKKYDISVADNNNFFANGILVHNSNLYRDHYHARSLELATGEDRGLLRALHAQICFDIPEGWRICGENLRAVHSIRYENLEAFFYIFSIWNERNYCLSWDETVEWATLLSIPTVPVLYRGVYDEKIARDLAKLTEFNGDEHEGYVIRVADSFSYGEFRRFVAKYVRPNHVTTTTHWRLNQRAGRLDHNQLKKGDL